MKQTCFILTFITIFSAAHTQSTTLFDTTGTIITPDTSFHKMRLTFRTRIINADSNIIKGYIAGFNDSVLSIYRLNNKTNREQQFNYQDLSRISFKRTNGVWRGMLWGFIIGAGSGVLYGYASGTDHNGWFGFTAGEKALVYGTINGVKGITVGAIIGALARTTITIHGKKERYDRLKANLRKYAY